MVVWMCTSMIVLHLVGALPAGFSGPLKMLKLCASSLGLTMQQALTMQFSVDMTLAPGLLVILSALVVRRT